MHRHRSAGLVGTGLLALFLFAAGCTGSDGASEPEAAAPAAGAQRSVRVETLLLSPTSFEDIIEITGTVEAFNDAVLSAQSAGTVVSLAERGAFVQAGQTIAQLDPGTARASVQQAEAQLEAAQAQFALAEDNLRRQEPLYQDSIISALEFENVRAQHNQARAEVNRARAGLAQAQEQLKNTRVTAPFAGTVEDRLVEPGEQVTPGRQVARIVSTSRVKVTAGVPERYAGDLQIGTNVQILLQAYGSEPRVGRVTFVGNAVNPDNRTFPVEIELGNTQGWLKPQMVATLRIPRTQLEGVLVIPRSAVVRDEDGNSVYVVTREGDAAVATRRQVELGSSYGGDVVVQAGLDAGDAVVVLGQSNLTEGDAVEVVEQHESTLTTRMNAAAAPGTDQPL